MHPALLRMSEQGDMSSHRRPRLPAPGGPQEDDDLLSEVLLRLPPQPSSLPRASLVCKRWRRLVSDPGFFRRFRAHHRRSAPLIGCFTRDLHGPSFFPTAEAPNRVPRGRFTLQFDDGDDHFLLLGCRHGLLLIFQASWLQLLVWDPVAGDQHLLALPPEFDIMEKNQINGAVLRAAGDLHFQVVLVGTDKQHTRALACVYSSETGVWGDLISTPLPTKVFVNTFPTMIATNIPSVLVGDSLYWSLNGNCRGILEFDLDAQSLAVMPVPVDMYAERNCHRVMPAEGGKFGILFLSAFSAQLWRREIDCNGVSSWIIWKIIELDKLLSLNPEEMAPPVVLGFAEENNVVFLWTAIGFFMVQLESLRFEKFFKSNVLVHCHPFTLALVVAMMELNFYKTHEMVVQLDMLL